MKQLTKPQRELADLIASIPEVRYEEFTVAKKNGKTRKIVNPSKQLKQYQRVRALYYAHVYRALANKFGLLDVYHGFIKGRSAVTGAYQHIGYEATVMCDISNFFDSVTKEMVEFVLGRKFNEADSKNLFHDLGYAAQGFPTSPTLANIAILPYVKTVHSKLINLLGVDNVVMTVYADDFQISYNSPDYTMNKQIVEIVKQQLDLASLELNTAKTRVRFAKFGFRKILGVNVGDDSIRATRRTVKRLKTAIFTGADGDLASRRSISGLTAWRNSPNNYAERIKESV